MITEKQLFDYVFFRGLLSEEIIEMIEKTNAYKEHISFYEMIKENLETDLSPEIKEKIKAKIPVYKSADVISLFPIAYNFKKRDSGMITLAAESATMEKGVTAKTFFDENKEYLVRVLKFESSTKIYIFSITDNILHDFTISLYPTGHVFSREDNLEPIEFNERIDVEKIDVSFA